MKDIIHLSAQDEESSQVDQRAGLNKPLQSRAVFFDNKRIPYQKKPCESIQFFWKKLRDTGSDVSFPVKIYENKGRGLFKFSKYTADGDVQYKLVTYDDLFCVQDFEKLRYQLDQVKRIPQGTIRPLGDSRDRAITDNDFRSPVRRCVPNYHTGRPSSGQR